MKVYEAINKVQADLCKEGITKASRNQQQGYNFRGIDAVYNALSPLLAKHGLCVLPRILERHCDERQTQKGGTLFYVTVTAEFDFVSAEDGSKHVVRTFGEAMDSGDKATNKAMSAAYKYAAMQAFAIPTEGDNDADAHTHEVAPKKAIPATVDMWESMSDEEQKFLQGIADNVLNMVGDDPIRAWKYIEEQKLMQEEKAALWTRLDSKTRTALRKAADGLKKGVTDAP